MQRIRHWFKPSLPKAMVASALAGTYALVNLSQSVNVPRERTARPEAERHVASVTPPNARVWSRAEQSVDEPVHPVKPEQPVQKESAPPVVTKKKRKLTRKPAVKSARVAPAKKRAPARRAKTTRRAAAPISRPARVSRPERLDPARELERLVAQGLEGDARLARQAIDLVSPIDELLAEALEEVAPTSEFLTHPLMAAVTLDDQFIVDRDFPAVAIHPVTRVAALIPDAFAEERGTLEDARAAGEDLGRKIVALPEWNPPSAAALARAEREAGKKSPAPIVSALPAPEPALVAAAPAPAKKEPMLVAPVPAKPPVAAEKTETLPEPEPELPAVAALTPRPLEEAVVEEEESPTPAAQEEAPPILDARAELATQEREERESPQMIAAAPAAIHGVITHTAPVPAPAAAQPRNQLVASDASAAPVPEKPKNQIFGPDALAAVGSQPPPSHAANAAAPRASEGNRSLAVVPPPPSRTESAKLDGPIYGVFSVDAELQRWMDQNGAHVQLVLEAVRTADPEQDTIYIGVVRPGEEFVQEARGILGPYRLVARFFARGTAKPQANVSTLPPIDASNFRERKRFHVRWADFSLARVESANVPSRSVVVTAAIFEAGASRPDDPTRGDFRSPQPVPGAVVTLENFEMEPVIAAEDGTVRLPNLPTNSEMKLNVTAPGYLATTKIITTSTQDTHVPVYLISSTRATAIEYMTEISMSAGNATILGRTFDPSTRTPLAGETVGLSFRETGAVYFSEYDNRFAEKLGLFGAWMGSYLGAVPDAVLKATGALGLFGYFNVTPSFRALTRPGKPALLTYGYPGTLQYFEFGRGGVESLKGKLIAPFSSQLPQARVRLVGDAEFETFTDEANNFVIPHLDYAGRVTVEIVAEGYGTTWHDISFSPKDGETEKELFLLEEELIEESARQAGVRRIPGMGTLVAGAEPSFFVGRRECVRVELFDSTGKRVPHALGPYPMGAGRQSEDERLCLTRRRSGFIYYNLPVGQYQERLLTDSGEVLRFHVLNVGAKSTTMAIN